MESPPPSHDAHKPEAPERPPIASAPLSVILVGGASTSDAAESVSAWQAYLPTLERPFDIVLLQGDAAHEANPVLDAISRIDIDVASGFGPALQSAIRTAQHPLVVLAPADRQIEPADLKQLLAVIDHGDLVIGCRSVHRPWWRRAAGWIVGVLIRVLLGISLNGECTPGATPWRRRWTARWLFAVRLADPESPFRLGRRAALARIVLQSRGPFALVEQLAKANHLEFMMAEEPVSWQPPPEPPAWLSEAWDLFRHPDFGPPELHIPPPAPPEVPTEKLESPPAAAVADSSALPAEKQEPPPTAGAAPSSYTEGQQLSSETHD